MSEFAPSPIPFDPLEADVDAAIAACDGDLRATIRALIVANGFLTGELESLMRKTSRGYARGRAGQRPT